MKTYGVSIFFFFVFITVTIPTLAKTPESSNTMTNNNSFINKSCGATLYPKLCYKTLVVYAASIKTNPVELANAALNVSLKSAQSTSRTVVKLSKQHGSSRREAGAIMDCVETVGDSIEQLKKSMDSITELDGPDFEMEMSNIQTWVSAALTDDDTCMDGFEGKEAKSFNSSVRGAIRSCIIKVAKLTSISLALINKISSS